MAEDAVYVNCAEGIKRMMNNSKLYVRLLAKFRDGTTPDSLEAAFVEGDAKKAQTEVHTLKGLAANLSLAALAEKCLETEGQIKSGLMDQSMAEGIKTVFAATLREIDKVIAQNG